jgi:hypothetical protein
LKFYFQYLDHQDLTINSDAFMEFGNADGKDVQQMATTLPRQKLIDWLKDPNTPPSRFGLYGYLLGQCGTKADAATLRAMLEEPKKLYSSGTDGMMAGYILLDKDAGWKYLTDLLADPKKEFQIRYACLRTLRFFWDYRADVIAQDKVLEGMKVLMTHQDMADMPIEDLRKRNCLTVTKEVLGYTSQPAYMNAPIIRRAVVKYLMAASAKDDAAKQYIDGLRKSKPDWVKVAEEALEFEKDVSSKTSVDVAPPPAGGVITDADPLLPFDRP